MPTPPPRKWRGPVSINFNGEPQREYKSLLFLGRVPPRTQLKIKNQPYHKNVSAYAKRLHALKTELMDLASDVFAVVEPSEQNVNATISSFDNAVYGDYNTDSLDYATKFFEQLYEPIFDDCISTSEEVHSYVDHTKSGGYTATFYNIKTKGELVRDQGYLNSDHHLNPTKTYPMTSVVPKKELKQVKDIMNQKIRLFFISEYHLVLSQLKFGKRSSNKLKNYHWSAFGFSPFMGGTNRLAHELNKLPIRFFYDISGWDKFVPLMQRLYEKIFKMSRIPDEHLQEFIWMMEHTINFICVLLDGDVIRKGYGNASGSGTTTRDNILMHVILAAGFLVEAYYLKYHTFPVFSFLAEQIVRLFGDDSVFAVHEDFELVLDRMDEEDGFLRSYFKRFGMKLKFLKGGNGYPVEKMEFLGFRFHLIDGTYYPYYDPIRLATSFIYTNDKLDTLEAYVSKCFVLTMMSFATEYNQLFLESYRILLRSIKDDELTPTLNAFRSYGPLTSGILKSFYDGAEAPSTDFSFFFSVLQMEEEEEEEAHPPFNSENGSEKINTNKCYWSTATIKSVDPRNPCGFDRQA